MQSEATKGATGWWSIDDAIAPNAPAWLRAWVLKNSVRALLLPSREENINTLGAAVQHNFRRTLLVPSREGNISSLGAPVQHNFRRTLLLPYREEISIACALLYSITSGAAAYAIWGAKYQENINSLGAAVQPCADCRPVASPKSQRVENLLQSSPQGRAATMVSSYTSTQVQSEAPEGAMGPAEGAIAPIAHSWLRACVKVSVRE